MPNPSLFFVHGAWSSPVSFSFLIDQLADSVETHHEFSYDCRSESIFSIASRARGELAMMPENTVVVGHSLGGLLAVSLHDSERCSGIVTLSAPFSGVETNVLMRPYMYSVAPILSETSPSSKFIRDLTEAEYSKPIEAVISRKGFNPMIVTASDGVVSVAAQERWIPASARASYVDLDHFEILQSDHALETVKNMLTLVGKDRTVQK